jgi:hypothetical protein
MKEEVIELLKKSNQQLVFLNAKITPVRSLVGKSKKDRKMHELALDLVSDKVIREYSGFWSLAETPGYLYIDVFTLTEEFFNTYCKRIQLSYQLSLFK